MPAADALGIVDTGEQGDNVEKEEEESTEPDQDDNGGREAAEPEAASNSHSQAAKGHDYAWLQLLPDTTSPSPAFTSITAPTLTSPTICGTTPSTTATADLGHGFGASSINQETRLVDYRRTISPTPLPQQASLSQADTTSATFPSHSASSPPALPLSLTTSSLSAFDAVPHPDNTFRPRASSQSQSLILPPPSPFYKFFRKARSASVSDPFHVVQARATTSPPGLRLERFWTPLHSILPSLPSPATPSPFHSPTPSLSSITSALPPAMLSTNNSSSPQSQVATGPDLVEIQTQALGFLAVAGEAKIKLLPEQWPSDSLPEPTSSLLAIASRSELLAAGAPNGLVIGTTSAVRDAFSSSALSSNNNDRNIKPFSPQLTIQTPRISQVAFSSDESCLIISAQQGGGLAVYQVDAIKQGSTEAAFQIGTDGIGVRALLPNPSAESAHLIALVLASGQLMIADLSSRSLADRRSGPVLIDGVSCISWSLKGKQLVAGLGNGTCVQLDPTGSIKDNIPRPPQLEGDQHVSAISWLDIDHFLVIFTPTNFDLDHAPDSTFFYVSRERSTENKPSNFMFQTFQESPCGPFGMNRSPPRHFISRLRQFPPDLDDTLIISSTASGDIGLITCSKKSLSTDNPNITNTYTTTSIGNDARKAQLPPSDEMVDTSPLGMTLDLSSKSLVPKPLPLDEMESSATPLPNLMVLNNEGLLCSWWFVYGDSIKQRQAFPGLAAINSETSQPQNQTPTQAVSAFGALGQNQFAQRAPAFGTPSASSIGGGSAFGSASSLGANRSAWNTSSNTNNALQIGGSPASQPVFGSSSSMGSGGGFGAVGGLGNRSSPWGTATQDQQTSDSKPANPFSNTSTSSTFASLSQQSSSNGLSSKVFGAGLGNAQATSGFAGLGQPSQSIFGTSTTSPPALASQDSFPSTVTIGSNFSSSFGQPSTVGDSRSAWQTPALSQNPSDAFSARGNLSQEAEMTSGDMDMETQKPAEQQHGTSQQSSANVFGTGSAPFKLQSQFKPDENDQQNSSQPSEKSLFGSSFGTALKETETSRNLNQQGKDEDQSQNHGFGLFDNISTSLKQDNQAQKPKQSSLTDSETLAPDEPGKDSVSESPVLVKKESEEEVESIPLPPDSTSLASPSSHHVEEPPAPLPPDPTSKSTAEVLQDEVPTAPLPPDPVSSMTPMPDHDNEPEAPLPPDPVSETPSKPALHEEAKTGLSPDLTTNTSARQPTDELNSSKLTNVPPSETPLRSTPNLSSPSTTPLAPPPVNQSPTRQPQTQTTVSTTPTAPPPSRQISNLHSTSKQAFQSSRLSRVDESPVRSVTKANAGKGFEDEYYDDSDVQIRKELQSDINPTRKLAPFLAHQDYVGRVPGQGIEVQIEKVYRDINSMIDTLGLNARSLKAFLEGHDGFQDSGMSRDSVESRSVDDWNLGEIADLQSIEDQIEESLDEQRLHNISQIVTELLITQKELEKLRSRNLAIRKLLHANQGRESSSAGAEDGWDDARKALTAEQGLLLTELQSQFAEIQKSLAKAEDSLVSLRFKVASVQSSIGVGSRKLPTFEGVNNTISKMTRMVEQRSGDVDLLESQIRKLQKRTKRGSLELSGDLDDVFGKMNLGASLMSSRGSLATPPSSRGNSKTNGAGKAEYQLLPDSQNEDERYESPLRHSNRSSSSKEQQKLSYQMPQFQVDSFNARVERRAQLLKLLKQEVNKRGTLVQTCDTQT